MRIMQKEAAKQKLLDERAEQERAARRAAAHDRLLQTAASRGRVERTMSEMRSHLGVLESALDERYASLERFTTERDVRIAEAQRSAVNSSLQRASLSNSMSKMRSCLSNTSTLYVELPGVRGKKVADPALRSLLAKLDPRARGQVSLGKMKKVLGEELPPPDTGSSLNDRLRAAERRRAKGLSASHSTPSFSFGGGGGMSYEQLVALFKSADTDGSGSISKRELYRVLKAGGIGQGGVALDAFEGFDEDSDGVLSFEEFSRIAKPLAKTLGGRAER